MTSHDRRDQTTTATSPARLPIAIGTALAAVGLIALPGPANTTELRPVAVSRAVADPPQGAYWHIRTLWTSTYPWKLGRGSNRYHVQVQHLSESWVTPDGKEWSGSRKPGARPKSAADERVWRRDGSPTRWSRTADGRTVSLSTRPDKGRVALTKGRSDVFYLAHQQLSYEELQRLPADPAALKGWIEKAVRVRKADPTADIPEAYVDSHVRGSLVELLHEVPAPKSVRVAAYRALPTMPGVHVRGKAKDALGRTGERLSFDHVKSGRNKDTTLETEVIVDTGTMLLLARGAKTTIGGKPFLPKTSTEIVLHVGWTDAAPSIPALP